MPQAIVMVGGWLVSAGVGASIAAFTAEVVVGAVVGAAIGGITAAVTGGDISKGLLYGALGGAVSGGIGAWASPTSLTTPVNQTLLANAPGYVAPVAKPGLLSSIGGTVTKGMGSAAVTGLLDLGGSMLTGSAQEDMAKEQSAITVAEGDKSRELQLKLQEMNNATSLKNTETNAAVNRESITSTYKTAANQLAAQSQEADVSRALDAESLARKQGALQQAQASRTGMLTGGASIDRQVADQAVELRP